MWLKERHRFFGGMIEVCQASEIPQSDQLHTRHEVMSTTRGSGRIPSDRRISDRSTGYRLMVLTVLVNKMRLWDRAIGYRLRVLTDLMNTTRLADRSIGYRLMVLTDLMNTMRPVDRSTCYRLRVLTVAYVSRVTRDRTTKPQKLHDQ